jgi:hypothetical protein
MREVVAIALVITLLAGCDDDRPETRDTAPSPSESSSFTPAVTPSAQPPPTATPSPTPTPVPPPPTPDIPDEPAAWPEDAPDLPTHVEYPDPAGDLEVDLGWDSVKDRQDGTGPLDILYASAARVDDDLVLTLEVDDLQRTHLRPHVQQDGGPYVAYSLGFNFTVGTMGVMTVSLVAGRDHPAVGARPYRGVDQYTIQCPDPQDPEGSRFRQDVDLVSDTVVFTLPVVCLPTSQVRMNAVTQMFPGNGNAYYDSVEGPYDAHDYDVGWFRYLHRDA